MIKVFFFHVKAKHQHFLSNVKVEHLSNLLSMHDNLTTPFYISMHVNLSLWLLTCYLWQSKVDLRKKKSFPSFFHLWPNQNSWTQTILFLNFSRFPTNTPPLTFPNKDKTYAKNAQQAKACTIWPHKRNTYNKSSHKLNTQKKTCVVQTKRTCTPSTLWIVV